MYTKHVSKLFMSWESYKVALHLSQSVPLFQNKKKKIEKAYIQNYSQLHTRQTLKINLNVVYNSKAVQGNVTNTHK